MYVCMYVYVIQLQGARSDEIDQRDDIYLFLPGGVRGREPPENTGAGGTAMGREHGARERARGVRGAGNKRGLYIHIHKDMRAYTHVCMYVFMYVCYVCMCVCMYVCMYVLTHECICIMYVCM